MNYALFGWLRVAKVLKVKFIVLWLVLRESAFKIEFVFLFFGFWFDFLSIVDISSKLFESVVKSGIKVEGIEVFFFFLNHFRLGCF